MQKQQFEHKIIYIHQDEKLDVESEEFNANIVEALDFWGKDGWEAFQVNTLMSGEKIRVYLKRRINLNKKEQI